MAHSSFKLVCRTVSRGMLRERTPAPYFPAGLAYGTQAPPGMEPNSVLLFDVQLLGIKKPGEKASGEDKK